MKIIHCADLHLDSKIENLPSDKAKSRREEIVRTFEKLCDYAKEENITAVIIAGDMFDTSRVTVKTKARVLQAISKCDSADFLYLSGNHDEDNFISEIEQLPKNLKIFGDEWTTFQYGNVTINGVKLTTVNSTTVYDSLKLEEDKFNVVVMHGQVVGYKSKDAAEIISIPRFKDKNVDYLALGHIHGFSEGKIDFRGKYVYSGCLDGRGFDETGDKGFVLLDVNENGFNYEFIKFSSRNLYEIERSLEGYDSWLDLRDEIVSDLRNTISEKSLVKVILNGSHSLDFDVDKDGLSMRLNEIFFHAKVYDRTQLEYNVEDYAENKSVVGEFVRAVSESDMDENVKQKVIMCGIKAVKGEEF